VPFVLPEYDRAYAEVVGRIIKALAVASDPFLSQIKFVPTSGTVSSVVQTRGDLAVDLPAEPVGFELRVKSDAVRAGDFRSLQLELGPAAEQYAEDLAKHVFASFEKITDATGHKIDAGGKLTFDLFYAMLDQMEWSLDDEDELSVPSIVMHPDAVKNLPEIKPEQQLRIDALKTRKHEELLARRRRRRLS
jgi:hypothetical protein